MELNEKFVKIGTLPVSIPMELGGAIQLRIIGEDELYTLECVKSEKRDLQNGTYDEIYILKHSP